MTQYAGLAKHFDMDNVEIAMLPGAPNKHGYTSYWILDPEKTQEVVDRLIYRENSVGRKESYTASIMRSTDQIDAANKLKESLEANGIRVMCTGTTSSIHSQFIAHSKYVTVDYYADLKKKFLRLSQDNLFTSLVTSCVQILILQLFLRVIINNSYNLIM